MTITIIRPSSVTVYNKGLDTDLTLTGGPSALSDSSDVTHLRTITRPNYGQVEPSYARIQFTNITGLPAGDYVSSIKVHWRLRWLTSASGISYQFVDPAAPYTEYNDYWYHGSAVTAATFSTVTRILTMPAESGPPNYNSYLALRLKASTLEIVVTGENQWGSTRSVMEIAEMWLEVTHQAPSVTPPVLPADNYWAGRNAITGTSGSVQVDLTPTGQTADDPHYLMHGYSAHKSRWFEFTAPSAGVYAVRTEDPVGNPAVWLTDTILSVLQGSPTTGWTFERHNDDPPDNWHAMILFEAAANEKFIIRVSSYGDPGQCTFRWDRVTTSRPAYDNLASRRVLNYQEVATGLSFTGSTTELDEKYRDYLIGSLWFEYTVPVEEPYLRFQMTLPAASGSKYPYAEMKLYELSAGVPVTGAEIAWKGYTSSTGFGAGTTTWDFSSTAGKKYYIQVTPDANWMALESTTFSFGVIAPPPIAPPPEYADFDKALAVTYDGAGYDEVDIAGAPPAGVSPASTQRTVWYKWTAPAGYQNNVSFGATTTENTYLSAYLYSGTSKSNLVQVAGSNFGYKTVSFTPTNLVPGQTYYFRVSDYYSTSRSLKVTPFLPRGGTLKVQVGDQLVSWDRTCTCPNPWSEGGAIVEHHVFWNPNDPEAPIGALGWKSGQRFTQNFSMANNTELLPGERVASGTGWTGDSGTWTYTNAQSLSSSDPVIFSTDGKTGPLGTYLSVPINPELLGSRLLSVTITALVRSSQGVYIQAYPAAPKAGVETTGVGGKFTSPGAYQWITQTYTLDDRSLREQLAWGERVAARVPFNVDVLAWQRQNTGTHEIAAVRVKFTLEMSNAAAPGGRLKILTTAPDGTICNGWRQLKCCGESGSGRQLKVKAGPNDWRKAGCFVKEPSQWKQLPAQTYEFNVVYNGYGIGNTSMVPNRKIYMADKPGSAFPMLGGFHGNKEIWGAAGGPDPWDEQDALDCAWQRARTGRHGTQWWSQDGSYISNGAKETCFVTDALHEALADYTDWPCGMAWNHQPATFGAGFGGDFDLRVFTTSRGINVNQLEKYPYYARPIRLIPPEDSGYLIEWEGGTRYLSWQYEPQSRGTLLDLAIAPDEATPQPIYGGGTTAPPAVVEWHISPSKSASQRNALGWGLYQGDDILGPLASGDPRYTRWVGSGADPNVYLNTMTKFAAYTGGLAPYWQVPDWMIQDAKKIESRFDSSDVSGLSLVAIPAELRSLATPPSGTAPLHSDRWSVRTYQHFSVKFTIKPQRYRTRCSTF